MKNEDFGKGKWEFFKRKKKRVRRKEKEWEKGGMMDTKKNQWI